MRTTRDIVQKMGIFIVSESPYDKDKEPTWKRWSGILQTKIWDLKILSKRTSPRISNIIEELELYLISLDQSFQEIIKHRYVLVERMLLTDRPPPKGGGLLTYIFLKVIVYIGETGAGKSRTAAEVATDGTTYYKPRGEWWDGYQQQNTVIIDDFYGWIKYDEILKICDRYPYQVPIKGGYEQFTSKRIIITSNEPIENWYKGDWYKEEQLKALKRRIDIYEYFMLLNNECIRSDLLFEINDTI